jgi:hypothetical protein
MNVRISIDSDPFDGPFDAHFDAQVTQVHTIGIATNQFGHSHQT